MPQWIAGRRRWVIASMVGLMVVLVGCPRAAEASVKGDMRAAAIRQRVAEQQARTRAEVNARLEASRLARVALLQTPPTPDPTPSPAPVPRRGRTSVQGGAQAPIVVEDGSVQDLIRAYWPGDDAKALAVVRCETGGTFNPTIKSKSGKYWGLWQADADFRASYGWAGWGVKEQTEMAWRGYQARGWSPWSCA